jgi:hypothetical protein
VIAARHLRAAGVPHVLRPTGRRRGSSGGGWRSCLRRRRRSPRPGRRHQSAGGDRRRAAAVARARRPTRPSTSFRTRSISTSSRFAWSGAPSTPHQD